MKSKAFLGGAAGFARHPVRVMGHLKGRSVQWRAARRLIRQNPSCVASQVTWPLGCKMANLNWQLTSKVAFNTLGLSSTSLGRHGGHPTLLASRSMFLSTVKGKPLGALPTLGMRSGSFGGAGPALGHDITKYALLRRALLQTGGTGSSCQAPGWSPR